MGGGFILILSFARWKLQFVLLRKEKPQLRRVNLLWNLISEI